VAASVWSAAEIAQVFQQAAAVFIALAALVRASKANRRAIDAEQSAIRAHGAAKEAARQQLTFALESAVRQAKAAGVIVAVAEGAGNESDQV
jgi:hypothetical protein